MKNLAMLVFLAAFLAACATQGQQARTEGTAGGALIGAAIGAALGALIGGGRGAAIGAGIGGFLGGASGYAYADNIAKRRDELAGQENNLDAQIQFARNVNQDTTKYNTVLRHQIDRLNKEVDTLVAAVNRQQITKERLEKERLALRKEAQTAKNGLALAEKELGEVKRFRSRQTTTSGELDAEIDNLERSVAQLRQNTSAMAALSQRI